MQLGSSAEQSLNNAPGAPRGEGKLRDNIWKPILEEGGFDPLAQTNLPPVGWEPEFIEPFQLADQIMELIEVDDFDKPWGFKAIKGLLFWKTLHKAFPGAQWVFVERHREPHIASLMATPFMTAYDHAAGWGYYLDQIDKHIDDAWETVDVNAFWPINAKDGNWTHVAEFLHRLGLKMNEKVYQQVNYNLYRS